MTSPHVLAGTELVPLPPSASGRRYQLHVSIPASGAREPSHRYPAVYLTDPYWDFPLVYATLGNLFVDQRVPECVIVGLGYPGTGVDYEKERGDDLAPVTVPEHAPAPGREGGAAEFLAALEQQIIPFAERTWPIDPARRILVGSSLGGLFGLYAMIERPGLFAATVAVSPAVMWAGDWLLGHEERFAARGGKLRGRLFLSGAADEGAEFLAAIVRFEERLRERAYPDLVREWRLVPDADHSSTKAEGFTRGLQFAFRR